VKRTTYVFRDGRMVNKATGEPMNEGPWQPATPQIGAFTAYACPITGKEIRTPQQHRDNLARHDCIEAKELPSPTGGKIKNERFARKWGLTVSEEYR